MITSLFLALALLSTTASGAGLNFPVVLPPYNTSGVDAASPKPEWGSCLLYLEGISIVVFNPASKDMTSAVATVNGGANNKNTFNFADGYVSCLANGTQKASLKAPTTAANGTRYFSFTLDIAVNDPAVAKKPKDTSNTALFTVDKPINLKLDFQVKADNTWNLTGVTANSLTVSKGANWLNSDLTVPKGTPGFWRSIALSKIGGRIPSSSYACSSTPAIIFEMEKDKDSGKGLAIGVAFNNLQVQPYGIWRQPNKDGKTVVRFGRNVEDCVGMFSVGSWMGIVVFLLLLAVLSLAYLMLNSVQTMDRFDDPKQKQIIISSKE